MLKTLALVLLCVLHSCAKGTDSCDLNNCNILSLQYYKEIGCEPVMAPGTCCPKSFDCSRFHQAWEGREREKCYFRGKSYVLGSGPGDVDVSSPCIAACKCKYDSAYSAFSCAEKECPESQNQPLKDGCVYQYLSEKCCSTGVVCPTNSSSGVYRPVFTCKYHGKVYQEGELFTPSDSNCKRCLCQRGFDGTTRGPWCTDVLSCGLELFFSAQISDGCAPLYDSMHDCCPADWHCPTGDDAVDTFSHLRFPVHVAGPTCQFGELSLSLGDKLELSHDLRYTCKCLTPPTLTCLRSTRAVSEPGPPGFYELGWRPFDPCSDVRCKPGQRCVSLAPWHTKCVS